MDGSNVFHRDIFLHLPLNICSMKEENLLHLMLKEILEFLFCLFFKSVIFLECLRHWRFYLLHITQMYADYLIGFLFIFYI